MAHPNFVAGQGTSSIEALPNLREAHNRRQCFENMKLLTLALLLYEKDHGKLPDGDWRIAVKPYLGENAERYFRCPSHPGLADGKTTYAMVSGVPNVTPSPTQILLVELREPQRFGEGDGRIPFEQATFETGLGSNHTGGINVGLRSGAVRSMNATINSEV